MRVLFAPDWREGVRYQQLLAEALAAQGVEVEFLGGYRRGLPLSRLLKMRSRCDILHLHWPEAYFPPKSDGWDWFRRARFPLDLALAMRQCPLATTAHNLVAHNRGTEAFARRNAQAVFRRAQVVFAHSAAAGRELIESCEVEPSCLSIIPHGDLSVAMPAPIERAAARAQLGVGDEKFCLMFGVIEPYKGLEEVIDLWRRTPPPARLIIAGQPMSTEYGAAIQKTVAGLPNVTLRLARLSDDELAGWLSAADCVLFNYRQIFTSGAATLARSWGVPVLLPARLETVDLGEPDPRVLRFRELAGDFTEQLLRALGTAPSFAAGASWRRACKWSEVARITAEGYRRALTSSGKGSR